MGYSVFIPLGADKFKHWSGPWDTKEKAVDVARLAHAKHPEHKFFIQESGWRERAPGEQWHETWFAGKFEPAAIPVPELVP